MRKLFYLPLCGICAVLLTGCGGGSAGSNLPKNDFLGSTPAIYDAYNAETTAAEQKLEAESEKLMAGGEKNMTRVQELFDDAAIREKDLKAKFDADLAVEMAAVAGREIPVTYSAALTPWFSAMAKVGELRGEPWLTVTLTNKDALTIPAMRAYDYSIYLRLVGAGGATLERSTTVILPIQLQNNEQTLTAGQVVLDSHNVMSFNLSNYAADRAGLAGVEFITKEEYDNLNK